MPSKSEEREIYQAVAVSKDDGHSIKLGSELYSCDDEAEGLEGLLEFVRIKYDCPEVVLVRVDVLHVNAQLLHDLKEGHRLTKLAADHMKRAYAKERRQ